MKRARRPAGHDRARSGGASRNCEPGRYRPHDILAAADLNQPPNPGGAAPELTFRDGVNLLDFAAPHFLWVFIVKSFEKYILSVYIIVLI